MGDLNRRSVLRRAGVALLGTGAASRLVPEAVAQRAPSNPKAEECHCTSASDGSLLDIGASEIRPVIERYQVELRDLNRVYALPGSALRQTKLEKFYVDQLQLLEKVAFDSISQAGKVDYLLLRDRLLREQKQLVNEARQDAEVQALVGSGKMTNRAFHDAMYREGNMPVEMVRLALNGQKVTRDYRTSWKFYGALG